MTLSIFFLIKLQFISNVTRINERWLSLNFVTYACCIFHNEDNEKNSIKTKYNNIKDHFIVKIKKYRIFHKIY